MNFHCHIAFSVVSELHKTGTFAETSITSVAARHQFIRSQRIGLQLVPESRSGVVLTPGVKVHTITQAIPDLQIIETSLWVYDLSKEKPWPLLHLVLSALGFPMVLLTPVVVGALFSKHLLGVLTRSG